MTNRSRLAAPRYEMPEGYTDAIGATAEHQLYGPVSANVGIRHREGFTVANFKEERYNAGLTYALTKTNDLGLSYYRVHNSLTGVDRDVVGVSVAHKF